MDSDDDDEWTNLSIFPEHNVVWMTVANAEHEGGHAVAGARACERVDHILIPIDETPSLAQIYTSTNVRYSTV